MGKHLLMNDLLLVEQLHRYHFSQFGAGTPVPSTCGTNTGHTFSLNHGFGTVSGTERTAQVFLSFPAIVGSLAHVAVPDHHRRCYVQSIVRSCELNLRIQWL